MEKTVAKSDFTFMAIEMVISQHGEIFFDFFCPKEAEENYTTDNAACFLGSGSDAPAYPAAFRLLMVGAYKTSL